MQRRKRRQGCQCIGRGKSRAAARTETKSIADKEKELNIEKVMHTEKMEVRTDLFEIANAKLKAALKTKDLKHIAVAQALLDAAEKQIEDACAKLLETRNEQDGVEKWKQSLIDSFVSKKTKTAK